MEGRHMPIIMGIVQDLVFDRRRQSRASTLWLDSDRATGNENHMTRLFEEMFQRPWEAMASSMRVLCEQAPSMITIDAFISRAIHILSRPRTAMGDVKDPQTGTTVRRSG
jgi:hypothetical protein